MEVNEFVKNNLIKYLLALSFLFILLSIILFSEVSFVFLGLSIVIIGSIILYKINH